jgi:hypothetical protein
MYHRKLSEMKGGWFVGDFEPTVVKTEHVEVAIKRYKLGDKEAAHVHRVATELTLCVSGQFQMTTVYENGLRGSALVAQEGDIIGLNPGDAVEFLALTDCVCCVVKMPSVKGDKYPV